MPGLKLNHVSKRGPRHNILLVGSCSGPVPLAHVARARSAASSVWCPVNKPWNEIALKL